MNQSIIIEDFWITLEGLWVSIRVVEKKMRTIGGFKLVKFAKSKHFGFRS